MATATVMVVVLPGGRRREGREESVQQAKDFTFSGGSRGVMILLVFVKVLAECTDVPPVSQGSQGRWAGGHGTVMRNYRCPASA